MKIDLAYPKIPDAKYFPAKQCIAFEKYDGTNIHFVWNAEKGWHAFGVRRDRYPFEEEGFYNFHINHKGLRSCVTSFMAYEHKLNAFFRSKEKYSKSTVIAFTEYFGPNSFAGEHAPEDHKKVVLFDIQVDNRILTPQEFLSDFSQFPIARVLYKGKFSGQLVEDIRRGKFDVKEGAVLKGTYKGEAIMVKVKTDAYLGKLKYTFNDDWVNYWE